MAYFETFVGKEKTYEDECVEKYIGHPCEGIKALLAVYIYGPEEIGEAMVNLSGDFAIDGKKREEFFTKLGSLIDEYRI